MRKFQSLFERKKVVEEKYGKWYEDPKYDPASELFDPHENHKMITAIMEDFVGSAASGRSIRWKDVSSFCCCFSKGFEYL